MRRARLRGWHAVGFVVAAAAVAAAVVGGISKASASSKAKTIRVAIMTDCKGAFGFGYEPDIGGAQAALATYAGGKAKNKKKPSAGMAGIKAGGAICRVGSCEPAVPMMNVLVGCDLA